MHGYETEFNLPLSGKCLQCKTNQFLSRQHFIRTMKTQQRLAALNAAFGYNDEEDKYWNSDSEAETESNISLNMPPFRNFARPISADTVEQLEEWVELRDGLARNPELVIPISPIVSYTALIESVDDEEEAEEENFQSVVQEPEVKRGLRWRSWIPLPTRLLRARSYRRLASINDDDVSGGEPLAKCVPKKRSALKSSTPPPGKQKKG